VRRSAGESSDSDASSVEAEAGPSRGKRRSPREGAQSKGNGKEKAGLDVFDYDEDEEDDTLSPPTPAKAKAKAKKPPAAAASSPGAGGGGRRQQSIRDFCSADRSRSGAQRRVVCQSYESDDDDDDDDEQLARPSPAVRSNPTHSGIRQGPSGSPPGPGTDTGREQQVLEEEEGVPRDVLRLLLQDILGPAPPGHHPGLESRCHLHHTRSMCPCATFRDAWCVRASPRLIRRRSGGSKQPGLGLGLGLYGPEDVIESVEARRCGVKHPRPRSTPTSTAQLKPVTPPPPPGPPAPPLGHFRVQLESGDSDTESESEVSQPLPPLSCAHHNTIV
jgi:hypothetical protein